VRNIAMGGQAVARGEVAPSFAAMAAVAATGTSAAGSDSRGRRPWIQFRLAESDKFSGVFSYAISVKVPPGRCGLQPDLTMLYRSTNSHSWLGEGWDLNPGRIERSTVEAAKLRQSLRATGPRR